MEELFDVSGKAALVTGGSRGIGRMIARGLVDAGCEVVIAARGRDQLRQTAGDLGPACTAAVGDVSTPAGCRELAGAATGQLDGLDILVNNAGVTERAPVDDYSQSQWDTVMDVNLRGVFFLTQALLPQLRAAGTAGDPARVINIGSTDGLRAPDREEYAYGASKAGLHHLTRHLAAAVAEDDITANAVAPGWFPSEMTEFVEDDGLKDDLIEACPRGRFGEPEDIAGTAIYLASRAGAYVTGAVLPVDGGSTTLR